MTTGTKTQREHEEAIWQGYVNLYIATGNLREAIREAYYTSSGDRDKLNAFDQAISQIYDITVEADAIRHLIFGTKDA